MQKRVFLITGSPGVGKTTVLLKTTDALKARSFAVGGMVSREVRSCGTRVGFEVMDLYTEKAGWLAHTEQKYGPKVGKFLVNLADLDGIGAEAIQKASKECDVLAIDEVGPMELFSKKFRQAVENAVDDRKPVIATFHWKAKDQLVKKIRARQDAQTFVVTLENRGSLPPAIATGVVEYLTAAKSV